LKRIRTEKKAQLGKKYVDSYIYKGDDNCYYEKIGSEIKNITNLIPFYIPENWSWARLGYIIDFSKNAAVSSNDINDNDWILDLEDIEKASGKLLCKKRMIEVKSKSDKHKFFIGNVLYSKLRPYLNKVIIADECGYCTTEILAFDFGNNLLNRYAQIYLMSPYFVNYAMAGAYGVKMPRIGSERGNNAFIPVPPLAEQKRIALAYHTIVSKLKDEI
jgi:type I restriction enzyme S subunit